MTAALLIRTSTTPWATEEISFAAARTEASESRSSVTRAKDASGVSLRMSSRVCSSLLLALLAMVKMRGWETHLLTERPARMMSLGFLVATARAVSAPIPPGEGPVTTTGCQHGLGDEVGRELARNVCCLALMSDSPVLPAISLAKASTTSCPVVSLVKLALVVMVYLLRCYPLLYQAW